MLTNDPAQKIDGIFNAKEIDILLKHFEHKQSNLHPTDGYDNAINKALDYDVPGSLVNLVVRPKINRLLGSDHSFSVGSYKECTSPYPPHIDNEYRHVKLHRFDKEAEQKSHNLAILIPLVENSAFCTVMFDIFSDVDYTPNTPYPREWLSSQNTLDLDKFDHLPEQLRHETKFLPVSLEATWSLGSVIIWRRNQLHTSTNFAKYGLTKKFIVIFLN